jgi:hypothetical protein
MIDTDAVPLFSTHCVALGPDMKNGCLAGPSADQKCGQKALSTTATSQQYF